MQLKLKVITPSEDEVKVRYHDRLSILSCDDCIAVNTSHNCEEDVTKNAINM